MILRVIGLPCLSSTSKSCLHVMKIMWGNEGKTRARELERNKKQYFISEFYHPVLSKTFPKQQILDSFKLKDFADDIFKVDEDCREFSKRVENTRGGGGRRNCSLGAISPFTTVFSKELYYKHVKTSACLGKD